MDSNIENLGWLDRLEVFVRGGEGSSDDGDDGRRRPSVTSVEVPEVGFDRRIWVGKRLTGPFGRRGFRILGF